MSFYNFRRMTSSGSLRSPCTPTSVDDRPAFASDLFSPGLSAQSVEEEGRMGLPPLEYLECYLDSPTFRENIAIYERELEANSLKLKALLKECKRMIQATEDYSKSLTSFASVLGVFSFETEGSEKSEDEALLAESLQRFSETLMIIEESRSALITTMTHRLVKNLETFRKENVHNCREEKKKFERASERYYQALDRYLSISPKKATGSTEDKSDEALVREMGAFRQASFQYVCMMQDIHAQKQYELMEPIIGYFSDISTFFHQAYDATSSMRPFVDRVQHKVQLLREVYLEGQSKRYELKTSVLTKADEMISKHPEFKRQGHLMVHEKKGKGIVLQTGWVRYFCQFRKAVDQEAEIIGHIKLIPIVGRGQLPREFIDVKECVRSRHDEADRRFCMELDVVVNRQDGAAKKYVVQAMNKDERTQWMDAMEGKEPIYLPMEELSSGKLTDTAFTFVTKCIAVIEASALDEEGLYRKPGQVNKAMKLMKDAVERRVIPPDLDDKNEWEIHIVCSAVKYYFSKQIGEPIMTFELHSRFVDAAKLNDELTRKEAIKDLIQQLPKDNVKMLKILMEHLSRVAAMSDHNLMKASNLGVCFGPTLMRPKHETVAAIADLKHESKVVEVLIDNVEEMFAPSDAVSVGSATEVSPPLLPPRPASTSGGTQAEEDELSRPTHSPLRTGSLPASTPVKPLFHPPRTTTGKVSPSTVPEEPQEAPEVSTSPPEAKIHIVPKHPHPSRPPPPPPDKPGSLVKQRSAVFLERSSTNGPTNMARKPGLPKNKPRVAPKTRSPSTSSASSEPPTTHSDTGSTGILDSADNRLADPTPNNDSPKEAAAVGPTAAEESKSKRSVEQLPTPTKEETRMLKLWNVGKRAVALYDCYSDDPAELTFKKNDYLLNVCSTDEDGWYSATLSTGQQGLVPCNYIRIVGDGEGSV